MNLLCIPRILVGALVCTLGFASAGIGQTTQAGGDFTFKRIGVPQTGGTSRITVQIDPDEEVFRITPGEEPRRPGDPRPAAATQLPGGLVPEGIVDFSWYWQAVSPKIGADPADRFQDALVAVQRGATKVGTPRLQTLKSISERHGIDILTSTIGTEVSPALVLAVIAIESAGRVDAESHAGAQGLMQLMPATAARFGVGNSFEPRDNIRGGVAYLDWLLKRFDRDPVMTLAAYNSGEGSVDKHEGVPPFAETRAYVPKVLAAWNVARGLCLTPPELVTDGCVFVGPSVVSSN
ncbi:MAG: lytic transglycosylase domain-containing protein [Boseongicola sp.]|nr:lytic transglycosylase domain-containing protein [Boseongicola sp.]